VRSEIEDILATQNRAGSNTELSLSLPPSLPLSGKNKAEEATQNRTTSALK